MSDTALTFLGQLVVAILGGGVVVAIIHSYLAPKTRAEAKAESLDLTAIFAAMRQDLDALRPALPCPAFEDPLVALERSAFAPISDAVREGEERAVREWNRTPAERDPHEDYLH